MATAVLEVDLASSRKGWTVDPRFRQALLLVRYREHPVDRVTLPVGDGRISRAMIFQSISERAADHIMEIIALDTLPADTTTYLPSLTATIAICTRDRPDDMRRCLAGVMALPDDGQDILVVDNCPTSDATEAVVSEFAGVQYVRETRPGLNHARNRALLEAKGEIVAFIDDDAVPDRGWLRGHLKNYDGHAVMAVTGLTMPLELDHPAQEAFELVSGFGRGFRRRVFSAAVHDPLSGGQVGAGANMSVRRSLMDDVGGFDNVLDAGTVTQSGGDHEIFTRILLAGYRIVYEPGALNWHRHRRTFEELEKTIWGYGVGVYACLTRALLVDGEWGVFRVAWRWFRHQQARQLAKAILRRTPPFQRKLAWLEVKGCLYGAWAYLGAVRKLRRTGGPRYA